MGAGEACWRGQSCTGTSNVYGNCRGKVLGTRQPILVAANELLEAYTHKSPGFARYVFAVPIAVPIDPLGTVY